MFCADGQWNISQELDGGDAFGCSVEISDDGSIALIGEWLDDTKGSYSGAVFVFTRTGNLLIVALKTFDQASSHCNVPADEQRFTVVHPGAYWEESSKLIPSGTGAQERFGNAQIKHDLHKLFDRL